MDDMTEFEARLAVRLRADAARGAPAISATTIADAVLATPRPNWRAPWVRLTSPGAAARGIGRLVLVGLVLVAIVAAMAIVGSRPRPAPLHGPAGNGLIAYETRGEVFVANPDGSSPRRVGQGTLAAFSPDGTRLAYFGGIADFKGPLYVIDVARIGVSQPTSVAGSVDVRLWSGPNLPAWSPDGTTLAVIGDLRPTPVDRSVPQVLVAPADGSDQLHAVTSNDRLNYRALHWSPDGSWIAFNAASLLETVPYSVGIVHPDGSGYRQLASAGNFRGVGIGYAIAWAPDSGSLLYSRAAFDNDADVNPARWELVQAGLDGTERVLASNTDGPYDQLLWSSDGRWIEYTQTEFGRLGVIDPATGTLVLSRDLLSGTCGVLWSPDGRYFLKNCAKFSELLPVPGDMGAADTCPTCAPGPLTNVVVPEGAQVTDWQRVAP